MEINSVSAVNIINLPDALYSENSRAEENELPAVVDLEAEIMNSSEEMADLISSLSRSLKSIKKKNDIENDFASLILEDDVEEKLNVLIKKVPTFANKDQLLSFARSSFPDDYDLMACLRELLYSRQLSELQKKKVKEAITDLEKFTDKKKLQSGMNIGKLAKHFSLKNEGGHELTPKDLRNSYLRFISTELPASLLYLNWVEEYGAENRARLLAFTLCSLIFDIKSSQPGIQYSEFGFLSSKLSESRMIHTMDDELITCLSEFSAYKGVEALDVNKYSETVIKLYLSGLYDVSEFATNYIDFNKRYHKFNLKKSKGLMLQKLYKVYNSTPDCLFFNGDIRENLHTFILSVMTGLEGIDSNTPYAF